MRLAIQRNRLQADLYLFLVATIWGSAFVAQRVAALKTGYFLYNGARFLVAALFLLLLLRGKPRIPLKSLTFSLLTGCILFFASAFQQAGLQKTSAANAGFITSLYVVFVPLVTIFLLRKNVPAYNWVAATFAIFGAFLLSSGAQLQHFSLGDFLELIGAVIWAFHVIFIGEGTKRMPALVFTFWQLIVAAALNLFLAFFCERNTTSGFYQASWSVLYTGIFSIGLGYFLQAVGQRHAPAVDASLILSLEAVFAALGGWIFLNETLTTIQFAGCLVIFLSAVFVQLLSARQSVEVSVIKLPR